MIPQEPNFYDRSEYVSVNQWENWVNLLDMANAVRYGFSQYRLPKPGQPIDIQESIKRVERIDEEWAYEHRTRGKIFEKPCPDFSSCSIEAQCYLHSILDKSREPEMPQVLWWNGY